MAPTDAPRVVRLESRNGSDHREPAGSAEATAHGSTTAVDAERLHARWVAECAAVHLAPLAFAHGHTLVRHIAARFADPERQGWHPFAHLVELRHDAEASSEVADALGQLAALRRILLEERPGGGDDRSTHDVIDECVAATVRHAVESLEAQTLIDDLTGLLNRRALGRSLPSALAHAHRSQTPLTVAMVDVDGLKRVNDVHGHDAGDATLREVAEAWRSRLRAGDDVFRVGGDEFVLILRGAGAEVAADILDRGLRASTQSFSWGIATHPGDGVDGERLLRVADARLLAGRAEHRRP